MSFRRGVHALEKRFHAFEKGCSHFGKRGVFTFIKIILSSCYWGVHAFEKRVNFLDRGFTLMKNTK